MRTFSVTTGKTSLSLVFTDDGRLLLRRAEGPGFSLSGDSEEFFFDWNGVHYSGSTPGWRFVS